MITLGSRQRRAVREPASHEAESWLEVVEEMRESTGHERESFAA